MQADQTLENLHKLQILRKENADLCRLVQQGLRGSGHTHTTGPQTTPQMRTSTLPRNVQEPVVLSFRPRLLVLMEFMLRQVGWRAAAQRALLRQTPALALMVEDE